MHRYSEKRRILYCSPALTFGGEQKQLVQILQHLNRERFGITICSIRPFGHLDEAIKKSGVPLICLGRPNPYDLRSILELRQIIKKHHIDLMQIGIFGSEFHGMLAALSTGTPVVAILQSMFDLTDRAQASPKTGIAWRCKWRTLYAVHGLLARIAKVHYVALSEAVKVSAIRELHLPSRRVSVVPLGLIPGDFDRMRYSEQIVKIKSELALNGAYPVLLNVSRLSPPKGLPDLLKAMPCIRERFPRVKLLIAGDGPLQAELEELRDRLDLHNEVLLLGRRDDIHALLHVADLFVFSSVYEGLPGAVIEAMAASKSVVAFDIPALREIIIDGQTGTLVRGRNTDQLAEAVIHQVEHPEIARTMGEKGRQVVQERFDIRQNMKSLEAIYEKMLTGSPVGS